MSTLRFKRAAVCALGLGLVPWYPVYAHSSLREGASDILGPLAWGLFLILPVPFLIIGTIGFLLYRKRCRQRVVDENQRS